MDGPPGDVVMGSAPALAVPEAERALVLQASTAVFAALGLVGGYVWRRRPVAGRSGSVSGSRSRPPP